jgi:hypothetical protein
MGFLKKKDKKSLIGSIQYQQTIMIHTNRVIFMILPLLFVPLVYGISSTPDACAAPNVAPTSAKCRTYPDSEKPSIIYSTCCWTEGGIQYCQHCDYNPGTGLRYGCGEAHPVGAQQPTPTPPPFGRLPPGVLGDLPTLEQVPTTPPPLFGRNEAAIPPTGGIEQPFTSTTPPLFGNIPQGGGFGVLQEPETPPTFGQVAPLVQKPTTETPTTPLPTPTPPPPDFAPQDNQGGGLPTIENQENIPPGGGVAEQPEDDGEQEDSSEGAETAGPLT